MNFREKVPEIRALANSFLELSEGDADALLESAGARGVTPSGWGSATDAVRRTQMILLLTRQDVDTLDRLLLVTDAGSAFEAEPSAPATSIQAAPATAVAHDAARPVGDGSIFVVHGHAHATLHEAVRVLERSTGREVVVLHEQPNSGRTILEKFEEHAANAAYAVVLLTADDEGGRATSAERQPRGRQNVIFELGFFFGTLGRRRVVVLFEQGVEKPSDIEGLVYIGIDASGAWKQALARELASAGINVDFARMP